MSRTSPATSTSWSSTFGAAGVCFPDLLLSKGEYQLKLPPPFIPGMEAAGVVEWAPEDSEFKVGERVSAFGILGGYAEQVVAPPANVTRSPAELDDAEAVSLLVNYNTMYFALARRAAMRRGESVLVLGSAGGVGTAAIQVARAMGASKVIAVVHRTSATEFVESLGADVVLPLTDGWAQAVREHTDGRGVDIVVDPVGGQAFDDAVRVLAIDGKLLVIGFAAGCAFRRSRSTGCCCATPACSVSPGANTCDRCPARRRCFPSVSTNWSRPG